MKNESEVVHWIKQKGIDTNPLDLFQFTACSLSISTEYGRPQKPYWESITLIKKSLHRLAPFFSVTKVDAINICWLCVVKGSILCVFYDMEKKILFVYCHLADYPGGKVSYGDALANNKTKKLLHSFRGKNRSFITPPPLRNKLSLNVFNVRNAIDTRKNTTLPLFLMAWKKNLGKWLQ